jgi:two-component system, NtrC family, nitrogen regulation response regulator NtrX
MPDPLLLADARAARFARGRPGEGAVELVGCSPAITRVQELIRRGAPLEGGALITAEPGAGVDAVARELHLRGRPSSSAYVAIDCAAGSPANVDRLLFGEPPPVAPTDLEAVAPDSCIAAARGGTLFLQNVTELRASAQAQLARIARDGEVRIGGAPIATAVRFVASASPEIDADVHAHRFRADLYRRLSTVRIDLPPLRDRPDDVPALALRLLEDRCAADGRPPRSFTQAALALVGALTWPGNLAELRDAVDRVVAEGRDGVIQIEHLLPALQLRRAPRAFQPSGNLRDARQRFERDYIASVLQHYDWRMAAAAQALGIQRPNLYRKARQLGIPLVRLSD